MDLGLRDSVVWITGASGGIGRAIAEAFAAEGASLVLHGNDGFASLSAWTSEQPWADRTLCVRADVRDADAMSAAADAGRARFGRLDICIANAGRWTPPDRPLHACDPERLRNALEINLLGAMYTARAFLQTLSQTGPRADDQGASLAFVGSTAGRFGESGHAEYAAAKAGLRGLCLSLKNEVVALDPWARVNVVEPGWTATPMARDALARPGVISSAVRTMPLKQLARPVDIASSLLFVSSPVLARHVSGEVLTVAGGMEGRVQHDAETVDEASVRRRLIES